MFAFCDGVDPHVLNNRFVIPTVARVLCHSHSCRGTTPGWNASIVNVRPPNEAMSLVITETETVPSTAPLVERDYVNQRHQQFQALAYPSDMSCGKRGLPAKHTPNK